MAEIKSLDDLKRAGPGTPAAPAPAAPVAAPRTPKRDAQGRSYATGKRKDAVARVWIRPGSGKFLIRNNKGEYIDYSAYFARPVLQMILRQPFQIAGVEGQFDVMATVAGGGLSGQAGAVKHGISKALQLYEPSLRPALKAAGFLTRDRPAKGPPFGGPFLFSGHRPAGGSSGDQSRQNGLSHSRAARLRVSPMSRSMWASSVARRRRVSRRSSQAATVCARRNSTEATGGSGRARVAEVGVACREWVMAFIFVLIQQASSPRM